ncbi:MAG: hypothetical protein WCS77_10760, partial [Elusimicrobiaceae bacterium]
GIGPGRAKQLYYTYGIQSPQQLKTALEQGALNGAEGFGPNALRAISEGLDIKLKSEGKMFWFYAYELAAGAAEYLKASGARRAEICGAIRLGEENTEKAIIVFTTDSPEEVIAKFRLYEEARYWARAGNRWLFRLKNDFPCELVFAPEEKFPLQTLFETGSPAHLEKLKRIAADAGLRLSPDRFGGTAAPCADETDIYKRLGLPFIPPELRAGTDEIELARSGRLPELVTEADIRGEFHNHTDLSDGVSSFSEMLEQALRQGLKWIYLGDHSLEVRVTRGLDYAGFAESRAELADAARAYPGITARRSLETEVLRDGGFEFDETQMRDIDFAIASVHSGFEMPRAQMTERIKKAVQNQGVNALAHPTGRIIGKRKGFDFDFEAVAQACAENRVAFEINAQPERQDLNAGLVRAAKKHGCKFIISTDAHSANDLRYITQGVKTARCAGLEKTDLLNCLDFEETRNWTRK